MKRVLPIGALAALLPLLACAAGPAPESDKATTVSLQAQADREVVNDEVVAVLAAEESGKDPAALAASVNRRMAAALAAVREVAAVSARTGTYQTYPLHKNGRVEGWRVSQQVRLQSRDFAAMAALIGRLQGDLVVRSMAVGLSDEARRQAEDALVAEATQAFQRRAGLLRQALGATGYRIRHLDVGASGGGPRPLAMEGVAFRAAAAPGPAAIEGGTSQVAVSVSGTIELAR